MEPSDCVSIIGLGKLGASMAAAVASRGFNVIGVDLEGRCVESINKGVAPVQETDLQTTIDKHRERLRATMDYKDAVLNSHITFVVVPTPSCDNEGFSIRFAASAFEEIGRALTEKKTYHLVVLTSTVLPGSTRYGLLPVLEREGVKAGQDFGLCYSPEFIALGSVIRDFLNPDLILIGEFDRKSGDMLENFYSKTVTNTPHTKRMSLENAELAKIALNTYVTTKITYANMIAELCQQLPGGDVDAVTDAIGMDSRVGKKYLTGALGYGGPCFPRDNVAMSFFAGIVGVDAKIPMVTHETNKTIVDRVVQRLKKDIRLGKTVGVLGLTYKPHTPILEESQGLRIALELVKAGATVFAYDPMVNGVDNELKDKVVLVNDPYQCIASTDVILIATQDPVFIDIDPKHFSGKTVLDFWRILDRKIKGRDDIEYIPFGRSLDEDSNHRRLAEFWRRTEIPKE